MKFVLLCIVCLPVYLFAYPLVPDVGKTPGELCSPQNRDFAGYRYDQHIAYCARKVSVDTKRQVYEDYAIPKAERRDYTIDHFLPLSMGGSNSRRNLWPEHKLVKATRQDLELDLFEELAAGKMTQSEVLTVIRETKTHCTPYSPEELSIY